MLSRVERLTAVSEPPLVGRQSASEAEQRPRPSGLKISGQEFHAAANERPNWRTGQPGLLTADHVASPTHFCHPFQNLAPGRHVDSIVRIGPERAVL